MSYKIEAVTGPVTLGEGPHWDDEEQALYFVSIFDCSIHKYVPESGVYSSAKLPGKPSFIIPLQGKKHHFAVSQGRALVEIYWSGEGEAKILREVCKVDDKNPTNRFNDAKADPRGRLFAGTMGSEPEPGKFDSKKGSLYSISSKGNPCMLADNIDISNGLCWNLNEKAFYYADSLEYAVRRYDYDVETGVISNCKFIFSPKDHGLDGAVDGMTIDTEGNLWMANFNGSQVIKVDPRSGKLLERIPIPALQVTSCTFGGPNLDELYVTTACLNLGEEQLPPCGSTFRITGLGVKGHKNNPCVLN